MKTFVSIILLLATGLTGLAATVFPASTNKLNLFYNTNVLMMPRAIIGDGQGLTNLMTVPTTVTNLTIITNNVFSSSITYLTTSNIYTTNLYATNTYIYGDLVTYRSYITNLYVTWVTNAYAYITNLYAGDTYTTNLFVTNLYGGDTYVSNAWITNLYAGDTYITNLYSTNITVSNLYVNIISNVNKAYITNLYTTNLYVNNTVSMTNLFQSTDYTTNLCTMAPDFRLGYCWIPTNAAFTFLDPIGIDPTVTKVQTTVVCVTNSSGSPILATAPANVHVVPGSVMYITNLTAFTFWLYPPFATNVYAIPQF